MNYKGMKYVITWDEVDLTPNILTKASQFDVTKVTDEHFIVQCDSV